jgi:hypothetical protein
MAHKNFSHKYSGDWIKTVLGEHKTVCTSTLNLEKWWGENLKIWKQRKVKHYKEFLRENKQEWNNEEAHSLECI